MSGPVSIVSWNVNGMNKAKWDYIKDRYLGKHGVDILCLQEIKCKSEVVTAMAGDTPDYNSFVYSHVPHNMHGVAVFIKKTPKIEWWLANIGMQCQPRSDTVKDAAPCCGRVLAIDLKINDTFILLVTSYSPNAGKHCKHLDYRVNHWDPAFFKALNKAVDDGKHVVWIGDINVAPQIIDVTHPIKCQGIPGFTKEERSSFLKFIDDSSRWCDIWRHQHPEELQYTCHGFGWYEGMAWRLDNCIVSGGIRDKVISSYITPRSEMSDISDHVAIGIHLDI